MLEKDIGIAVSIDPTLFSENLFLYFVESENVENLISLGSARQYKYHRAVRFIYDLCAINECNEFFKSFKSVYPKEHELKLQYQRTHATFLDVSITIKDNIFMYKHFGK